MRRRRRSSGWASRTTRPRSAAESTSALIVAGATPRPQQSSRWSSAPPARRSRTSISHCCIVRPCARATRSACACARKWTRRRLRNAPRVAAGGGRGGVVISIRTRKVSIRTSLHVLVSARAGTSPRRARARRHAPLGESACMRPRRSERAQAAVAVVGLLTLAGARRGRGGRFLRASLVRQRVAGTADGAALAAGAVLRDRDADLLPRTDPRTHRRLPPLLRARARRARAGGRRARGPGGRAELVSLRRATARAACRVRRGRVRAATTGLPGWLGGARLRALGEAHARAGLDYPSPAADPGRFRPVDLRGAAGVDAVIAAASAQLGWPYLWGGESRAEGGFDCSGLIDYALAAAGSASVGRPPPACSRSRPVPLAAVEPGDLVFVGAPAHHVGLVVAPGLAIEAPHTGAVVHYERLADGGWTSAGRLAALAGRARAGRAARLGARRYRRRARAARAPRTCRRPCSQRSSSARALRPHGRLAGRGEGIAQFMPDTWAGAWNPWRARSPFDPARRSARRRATCTGSSSGPAATSGGRSRRTTTAGRAARRGRGRR